RTELWPRRFDLALLPRWGVDLYGSTFLGYFSGAAERWGYSENVDSEKKVANWDFDLLLTRAVDDRSAKHEVERNLSFLKGSFLKGSFLKGSFLQRSFLKGSFLKGRLLEESCLEAAMLRGADGVADGDAVTDGLELW